MAQKLKNSTYLVEVPVIKLPTSGVKCSLRALAVGYTHNFFFSSLPWVLTFKHWEISHINLVFQLLLAEVVWILVHLASKSSVYGPDYLLLFSNNK